MSDGHATSGVGKARPERAPARSLARVLDQVGRRVSLRRVVGTVGGRETLGDVVGVLEKVSPASVSVRRRDGSVAVVARASVVGARLVPAHPRQPGSASYALSVPVEELESVAARGWPGTERGQVGAWLLRSGHGFTGRANSALPIGDPGRALPAAVAAVEEWYRQRGLPPRFQVPFPGGEVVDDLLDRAGYEAVDGAVVLVADLLPLLADPFLAPATLRIDARPDDDWLSQYHYRAGALPAQARAVIESGDQLAFVAVTEPPSAGTAGGVVAIARGAVDDLWLGVTAVEVATSARRQGLATTMLLTLAGWARERGALAAYLQVADGNDAAHQMYTRAGFVEHHRYHYRRLV